MVCIKAMGSRIYLDDMNERLAQEYSDCVKDLMENELVQRLGECPHHMDISRLQHVINVSYYSFLLAEKFGLDTRACARAGLLHDLFFYDYRTSEYGVKHTFVHPRQALDNARTITELSDKEEEIILNHMWPACIHSPRYMETYVVSMVDKYCATFEAANYFCRKLKYSKLFSRKEELK